MKKRNFFQKAHSCESHLQIHSEFRSHGSLKNAVFGYQVVSGPPGHLNVNFGKGVKMHAGGVADNHPYYDSKDPLEVILQNKYAFMGKNIITDKVIKQGCRGGRLSKSIYCKDLNMAHHPAKP